MTEDTEGPIVLYDGTCGLCDATVRFVVARDPGAVFRFAALGSPAAEEVLADAEAGNVRPPPDSVALVQGGRVHYRSSAALRIARRLRVPWNLAYVFILVPRVVRDAVYDFVAKRRRAWFGESDACSLPGPDVRARMLS